MRSSNSSLASPRGSAFSPVTLVTSVMDSTRAAKLWVVLSVGIWVLCAAYLTTGQFGDNIEQFNWAHSMEWGYYKHLPLATWLLSVFVNVFGQAPWQTLLLAFACTVTTGLVTHDIAKQLCGERVANLAIVLWSLQMPFSWRAQMYNHNTLLVMMVAITVWCALRALKRPDERQWWIVTGVAGGLAMLAKYQALVPLTGVLIAMSLSGEFKQAAARRGALLAVGAGLLVITPHLAWLVQHDWQPLRYAAMHDQALDSYGRPRIMFGFFANQLRFQLPALICIAVLALVAGVSRSKEQLAKQPLVIDDKRLKAWLIGLLAFPLLVLCVMGVARGVNLQNHWGVQSLQFLSLWMAARLWRNLQPTMRITLVCALALQICSLLFFVNSPFGLKRHGADLRFPTAELISRVDQSWRSRTSCPLKYAAGTAYVAGMYSAYSPMHPLVLENSNPQLSPWVDMRELRRKGAVYFSLDEAALPVGVQDIQSMKVIANTLPSSDDITVYWGLKLPYTECY